ISLWQGQAERGFVITDLGLRHADGSVKAVQIHVTLILSAGVTTSLKPDLGRPPRSFIKPLPPKIDSARMRAPRLIACTDPWHLCASRIAPYPLVPLSHPGLPDQWRTFLATEFDSSDRDFPCYGNLRPYVQADGAYPSQYWGGNANYNFLSALY